MSVLLPGTFCEKFEQQLVGMENSKIHRTEHDHLSHLDTEHMV